jgi:hypothetical protein
MDMTVGGAPLAPANKRSIGGELLDTAYCSAAHLRRRQGITYGPAH